MPRCGQKCVSWKREYAALAWRLYDDPTWHSTADLLAAMAAVSDKPEELFAFQVKAWCTYPTRLRDFVTVADTEPRYRWRDATRQPPVPRPTAQISQELVPPLPPLRLLRKSEGSGRNWCGPLAMTAITGRSYEECEQLIQRMREDHPVVRARYRRARGGGVGAVYMEEITHCLGLLGYRATRRWSRANIWERLTLGQWVQRYGRDWAAADKPVLILITGHFVVFYRGRIYDNRNLIGSPVTKRAYAARRVYQVCLYELPAEQAAAGAEDSRS